MISKISKGTKMDQIYIPKNRIGFEIGSYVFIKPAEEKTQTINTFFYGVNNLEPIKMEVIQNVFTILTKHCDTVIITGSFLDKGFNFNDIDIIVVVEEKIHSQLLVKKIEENTGIKVHLITLNYKTLKEGLETDPLYKMMISKCVSSKRIVLNVNKKINFKLLDIHLLKSKQMVDNYDILNGNQKYHLTRNMIAILLFLGDKRIHKEAVDKSIESELGVTIHELKDNMLDKQLFLRRYKSLYNIIFNTIMKGINHDKKQKQTN
ncbi:MAG: hypothetical protein ACMXYE_00930 [Candidatus Woesearchaeota archaeon]